MEAFRLLLETAEREVEQLEADPDRDPVLSQAIVLSLAQGVAALHEQPGVTADVRDETVRRLRALADRHHAIATARGEPFDEV